MSLTITPSFVAHQTAKAADMEQLKSDIQTWANNFDKSGWATWTPTITSTGGTFTSVTTPLARWTQIGKTVIGNIVISGTAGGGVLVMIHFTPPVTPLQNTSGYVNGFCSFNDGGVPYVGHMEYDWLGSTTKFTCQREIQAVIANGSVTLSATFIYEVA